MIRLYRLETMVLNNSCEALERIFGLITVKFIRLKRSTKSHFLYYVTCTFVSYFSSSYSTTNCVIVYAHLMTTHPVIRLSIRGFRPESRLLFNNR